MAWIALIIIILFLVSLIILDYIEDPIYIECVKPIMLRKLLIVIVIILMLIFWNM